MRMNIASTKRCVCGGCIIDGGLWKDELGIWVRKRRGNVVKDWVYSNHSGPVLIFLSLSFTQHPSLYPYPFRIPLQVQSLPPLLFPSSCLFPLSPSYQLLFRDISIAGWTPPLQGSLDAALFCTVQCTAIFCLLLQWRLHLWYTGRNAPQQWVVLARKGEGGDRWWSFSMRVLDHTIPVLWNREVGGKWKKNLTWNPSWGTVTMLCGTCLGLNTIWSVRFISWKYLSFLTLYAFVTSPHPPISPTPLSFSVAMGTAAV